MELATCFITFFVCLVGICLLLGIWAIARDMRTSRYFRSSHPSQFSGWKKHHL
jgi:hypothetical protein